MCTFPCLKESGEYLMDFQYFVGQLNNNNRKCTKYVQIYCDYTLLFYTCNISK